MDYIAEHLTKNGRAGIIVPEGIIFQTANSYKALRKMLVEKYLYAVVSLPSGIFQPYSGVKTSILLFDKQLAKKVDKILLLKVSNDGFDLGAKRQPISKNDLPQALEVLNRYKKSVLEDLEFSCNENSLLVDKIKLAEQDFNLSFDRYKTADVVHSGKWDIVRLGDITTLITKGTTPTTIGFNFIDKGINFVKIESILDNGSFDINKFNFIDDNCHSKLARSILEENDILFSIAGALGKVALVTKYILPANTNQALSIIRLKNTDNISIKYIYLIIKSNYIRNSLENLKTGVAQFNLSLSQISDLKIPLPPLEIQQQIVDKIEQYQKIIDGAKQVVENYKPTINIEPEWEMVKLGTVTNMFTGGTPKSDIKDYYENGNIKWLVSGDIHKEYIFDCEGRITKQGFDNSNAKYLPINSVLIALNGQGKTRGTVAILRTEATCNQSIVSINPHDINYLLPEFLYYQLKSKYKQIREITGENQRSGLNMPILKDIKINVPPLETQQKIVNQIEQEQALVNSNKELIKIFEDKIKQEIDRVWRL